jgi:uncharacterized protein with FMN-binding domain
MSCFDERMALDCNAQINDPLLERLERLAARQGQPQPAQSFPPPTLPQATPRTRRRHPARSARVVSLIASCATTSGLVYFFAGSGTSQASSSIPGLAIPIATTSPTSTTAAAPSATIGTATNTASPATTEAPATTAANATDAVAAFEGDTIQTRYGPVEVQAQIANGNLVAVAVVQYPDGDRKSVRINERALPQLQSEALAAQSAQVDTVSGATYTSDAFVNSLQSAIDEALAAGAMTA